MRYDGHKGRRRPLVQPAAAGRAGEPVGIDVHCCAPYLWNYYNRKINKLITRNIIRNRFYEEIRKRIKQTDVVGII